MGDLMERVINIPYVGEDDGIFKNNGLYKVIIKESIANFCYIDKIAHIHLWYPLERVFTVYVCGTIHRKIYNSENLLRREWKIDAFV